MRRIETRSEGRVPRAPISRLFPRLMRRIETARDRVSDPSGRRHNPTVASMASRKFTDITCRPCPGGTIENSPAFQGWVKTQSEPSPEGTAEIMYKQLG